MLLEKYGGAKQSDFIIVSHHTLDADYLDYTWPNHRSYAKKHEYDYWFRNGVIDRSYADPAGKNKILRKVYIGRK